MHLKQRFKYIKNKEYKYTKASWGARYVLLILSKLTDGLMGSIVDNIKITDISNRTYLSERTVSNHIKELKNLKILDIERDLIFGKGRGVNRYILYEKFNLKSYFKGLNDLIIERILWISDLSPIQKFILVILINEANELGVVRNLGFSGLTKITGISRNALKSNVQEMIRCGFIFGYTSGGNLPIYLNKIKSCFYINFVQFPLLTLIEHGKYLKNKKANSNRFEVKQYFTREYKFIDIDVIDYFDKYSNDEIKEYLNSLSDHNRRAFFNESSSVIYFYTGILLSLIRPNDKNSEHGLADFIVYLKQDLFKIKSGFTMPNRIDFAEFKIYIDRFHSYRFANVFKDIKKELFNVSSVKDNLDGLRSTLYSEMIFLIKYYAFRIHIQIAYKSQDPQKYTIAMDYKNVDKKLNVYHPKLVLLGTVDDELIKYY